MSGRDNWAGLMDLLKELVLTKYGWKGEVKPPGTP